MKKSIIILGPTAIGKTDVSITLAKSIDAEIISSDSVQIYKYMDIGAAKPTLQERKKVKHHLIDIRLPNEHFSSGEFVKEVGKLTKDITFRGKNVIIVGGGGFYIYSLVFGLDKIEKTDEKIKRFFDDLCEELSPYPLYEILKIVDEKWAHSIKPQDCQRIKRGLSVYFGTQKELSGFFSRKTRRYPENYCIFVLYASRSFINQRIENRVDKMIKEGLVDEVKKLLEMGFAQTKALQSIGYKEILEYLTKKTDEKAAVELIKKNTKAYAKRQMTLLRSRFAGAVWIDVEKEDSVKVILERCKPYL